MTEGRIRLGAEIQRRRKQLGLTQEELAQRMDVSRQSVTKWETGQSAPDLDRLVQLREVLSISLDELLKGPADSGAEPQTENDGESISQDSAVDSRIPADAPPDALPDAPPDAREPALSSSLSFFFRLAGGMSLFVGLAALLALWVFSVLFPVQLTDWDGNLYTGLEGYLMAHDYQPLYHAALGATGCGAICLLAASPSVRRHAATLLTRLRTLCHIN